MEPFLAEHSANPSGMHAAVARGEDRARGGARRPSPTCAVAGPREIVFTGGGSEGDNLAVKGAAWAARADAPGADGVVTTGIEHKAVLGACDRLAREGFRVARDRRRRRRRRRPRRARRRARRAHRGRVGDARQQRDRHRPAARRGRRARPRAARRSAVLHTDAVQAPQWLDLAHRGRASRPRRDLGAQVRRPEGRRRARRARRRRRSCRWSKAAVTKATDAAGTQNVAGIVGLAAALRVDRRAARPRRSRASPRCATGSKPGLPRRSPGFAVNGDPRPSRRRHPALRVPGHRSRDAARRARPAGRLRRVGFGVQLGRDRSVARAARDGHGAATGRCRRSASQPRLRVDRRRHRRRARDRSRGRRQARGSGCMSTGHGDDERRGRLVGRGRACCATKATTSPASRSSCGAARATRGCCSVVRRRGRAPRRRAARHPALRVQLRRRLRRRTSSRPTSTRTRRARRRTRASSATAR